MSTLRAILEEVSSLESGYLISDHGAYWLVSDLLERLEQDAPERLAFPVSWVVPDDIGEGAIYASDDAGEVLSTVPLYGVHRLGRSFKPLDFPDTGELHLYDQTQ
jgi:hypothetical protein